MRITSGELGQREAAMLNEALDRLERLESGLRGGTGVFVRSGADSMQITGYPDHGFWGRVVSGSNPYVVNKGREAAAGTTENDEVLQEITAYEVNGREDVPADEVVWVERGFIRDTGEQDWTFVAGGGGVGKGGRTCDLARLRTTDCLAAMGPENTVILTWAGGPLRWTSTEVLTYPGGEGLVEFWYAAGAFHLKVGSAELTNCGDSCFTGGQATGLTTLTDSDPAPCKGPLLEVCVKCVPCDMVFPPCEPLQTEGAPATLWAVLRQPTTGSVGCVPPIIQLNWVEAEEMWMGQATVTDEITMCMALRCCGATLGASVWCQGEPGWPATCDPAALTPAHPCNLALTLDSVHPLHATGSFTYSAQYCCDDWVNTPEWEPGLITVEIVETAPPARDPLLTPCCSDGESLPTSLFATVEALGPECSCLNGLVLELIWVGGVDRIWRSAHTPTACGTMTAQLELKCWVEQPTPKPWSILFSCNSTATPVGYWPPVGFASGPMPCDPLALNLTQVNPIGYGIGEKCCLGALRFHITD